MKKILLLGILVFGILFMGNAQTELKSNCALKINLSGLSGKPVKIYLSYMLASTVVIKDTLFAKGGVINLTKKLDEPCLAMLSLQSEDDINYLDDYRLKKGLFSFFLQPGVLTITCGINLKSSKISNTLLQREYWVIHAREKLTSEKEALVNAIYQKLIAKHDTAAAMQKLNEIEKIKENLVDYYKSYIVANPEGSFLTIYALQKYFSFGRDLYDPNGTNRTNTADSLYHLVNPALTKYPSAIALKEQISNLKDIEIGKIAPDFTADDTLGRAISLSSLRGKYVLIDFWASWCAACRAQFPYLKKIYGDFSSKRFEILGVALDEKSRWKNALKEDHTPWLQVIDKYNSTKSAATLYHISPIPMNYLIDPGGKIITNNLSPDQLRQKLHELLSR